jgi:hypothetical protein
VFGHGATAKEIPMTDIATSQTKPRRFLSRKEQADRYGRSTRTIKRWGTDPKMGMPQEYEFNGPHRDEAELEIWERTRIAPPKD